MNIIPVVARPNQSLIVTVGGQSVRLDLWTRGGILFADVTLKAKLLLSNVPCYDRNRIVRSKCYGVSGDFSFIDQQGTSDPQYPGLGSRYLLAWFTPAELQAMGYDE